MDMADWGRKSGASRRGVMSCALWMAVAGTAWGQSGAQPIRQTGAPELPPPEAQIAPEKTTVKLDDGSDRWRLGLGTGVWYVAPAGKLRMPSAPGTGEGDELELNDLNLDSPRMGPYAEIDLRRGRWGLTLSGMAFTASDRGAVMERSGRIGDAFFAEGDRVESSLDFVSAQAGGTYRFWHFDHNAAEGGGWDLESSVDALLGARVYDTQFDIRTPSAREQSDEFFAEPIVGLVWRMEIGKDFTVDVRGSVGYGPWGDRSSWSFDIAPTIEWRPIEHVGIEGGYRLLVFDLSSGDGGGEFDWRGSMAGVYLGLVVKF